MKKSKTMVFIIFFIFIFLCSCSVNEADKEKNEEINIKAEEEFIIPFEINSKEISQNNKIDDNGIKTQYIYLPPNYYKSKKSYPVLYYFHGFGDSTPSDISYTFESITESMKNETINEMIIVEVDAKCPLGGSFMKNSPVIGNWENYFFDEVIKRIEKEYRILPNRESRTLAGFSMGGYITIELGFSHPEYFSSIYAVSPGLLVESELKDAFKLWDKGFIKAYGSAFAPNIKKSELYSSPKFNNTEEDKKIIKEWLSGFSNIENKIENYLDKSVKLSGIYLEVGSNDDYPWIYSGTKYFSNELTKNNIKHNLKITDNYHEINESIILNNIIYNLSKHFKTQ